jgi:diguanylate cyclase (GGDEF)-like protein
MGTRYDAAIVGRSLAGCAAAMPRRTQRRRWLSCSASRTAPLKTRLNLANLAMTGGALFFALLLLFALEYFSLREALLDDITVQARIIAENSSAAVIFKDRKAAEEILAALKSSQHVESAAIFTPEDVLLASYRRNAAAPLAAALAPEGHRFSLTHLELAQAIEVQEKPVGRIRIRSSLNGMYSRLAWYTGTAALAVIAALGAALLMLSRFRKELSQAEQHLDYLAHYDALTALPNRNAFNWRLAQAMARAERNARCVALMFLDLDNFKIINDTFGHHVGDELLKYAAQRLTESLRASDTVSRLGGDEFTVILEDLSNPQSAAPVAEHLIASLHRPFQVDRQELYVGASIGISVYPQDAEGLQDLIRNADTAMYHAKEKGKNNYQFFSREMNNRASRRLSIETRLRRGLEREEFFLHYQPQVDLASERIVGVEALLRWRQPELGLVDPTQFIAIAEETGLIVPIGEWVLRTACAQNQAWNAAGLGPLRVGVNLSARQLRDETFAQKTIQILRETGLEPALLELELTESVLMERRESTRAMLDELRSTGVALAIDDFGTGYSSMAYLKRVPISKLKIGISLVRDAPGDPDDAAIIAAIIAMGHSLKLHVLAEGAENAEQVAFLAARGCDSAQGYYFSEPLPAEELTRRLEWKARQAAQFHTVAVRS